MDVVLRSVGLEPAALKILHPADSPSDEEFDEYVAYAIECRRRVKEQMNKRKPDDEFAKIALSYIDRNGSEIVVPCPETANAHATLEPARRRIGSPEPVAQAAAAPAAAPRPQPDSVAPAAVPAAPAPSVPEGPAERHYTIHYGDTGHSYDTIFGPYLDGAKAVLIEDPYIRMPHQIANLVRFCETVVKSAATVRSIKLITAYDQSTDLASLRDKLGELGQSLSEVDVALDIELNEKLHDREIRIDNGWVVKIGRGLDFFQKPESWYAIGASDQYLRRCLETKVDIFLAGETA